MYRMRTVQQNVSPAMLQFFRMITCFFLFKKHFDLCAIIIEIERKICL